MFDNAVHRLLNVALHGIMPCVLNVVGVVMIVRYWLTFLILYERLQFLGSSELLDLKLRLGDFWILLTPSSTMMQFKTLSTRLVVVAKTDIRWSLAIVAH
jgi:hypothetical protein